MAASSISPEAGVGAIKCNHSTCDHFLGIEKVPEVNTNVEDFAI